MATPGRGAERRAEGLSRTRIVDAAVELLDTNGASGLTFRALAAHLSTGPGALYWHIANREELLVAATEVVIGRVLADVDAAVAPRAAIHAVATAIFAAIDTRPWLGEQLVRTPPPPATLRIFERIGVCIQRLGVSPRAHFTAATVLGGYVIGESRRNAANGRFAGHPDRLAFLDKVATEWKALDAREFPFLRSVADRLREHDDRSEFLAGVDLILAGIAAGSGATSA